MASAVSETRLWTASSNKPGTPGANASGEGRREREPDGRETGTGGLLRFIALREGGGSRPGACHNSPIKTPGLRDANLAHMIGVRKENEHGESPHWALSLARRVHKWAG